MGRGRASGLGAVVGLALACLIWRPAGAEDGMSTQLAESFVQSVGDRAVEILRSCGREGASVDQEALGELIRAGFNIELIGRFVLGKYWRTATPEQKADYQQLFNRFVIKSYAVRMGGFAGTTFQVTKTVPVGDQDILVTTRIDRPSGAPIEAGWRVREIKGHYKIIDVVVEGVSMAATQRQEFASVVKSRGLPGLLQILRARTQTLAASG